MSIIESFRALLNLRTFAVAAIFILIVCYYYSTIDLTLEVPVSLEKRIDLIAKLDGAVPDYGFDGKKYWLNIVYDYHDNEDDPDLVVRALPNSQFHYDDVPIYRNAVLKLGFGFYEAVEGVALQPVTFEVEFQTEGDSKVLFSKTLIPMGWGRIKQYARYECPLSDFKGEKGRLVFRCKSDHNYKKISLLCGWVSPIIDSEGKRIQLKDVFFQRSTIAHDFIEARPRFPTSSKEKAIAWAHDAAGNRYEAEGPCFLDFGFVPLSNPLFDHSGSRAALAFAQDFRLIVPGVEVPENGLPMLCFAIGLKELACAAGGAEFSVLVGGERVFCESIAGGSPSDRWRDRRIDLEDFAGEAVEVAFDVKFSSPAPRDVEVPELNLLRVQRSIESLHVERSIAGFGHPVLLCQEQKRRCFSKKTEPNLIVVNIECLHSGYLGCYGSPLGLTPVMDLLADEGLLFKDFVATSSWTLPSVATLLTGVYPSVHGATREDRTFLPNRYETLPELMQRRGITTAAFVTNKLVSRESNFDQGFETFVLAPYQNARKVNFLFNNWLASHHDFRFFAYFHYFEPHDPCNAPDGLRDQYVPEPLRGKDAESHKAVLQNLIDIMRGRSDGDWREDIDYMKGRYYGEIAYMDKRIKELLNLLDEHGVLHKTVILVTGDHGEEFMEHGYLGHGSQLYGETIRVPLIIWGPREVVGPHRILEGMSDNASLFNSMARLMGVPLEDETADRVRPSLFPLDEYFTGRALFAFSETDKAIVDPTAERIEIKSLYTLMNWRYKLISDGRSFELYDLVEDHLETKNRAGMDLPEEKALMEQLEGLMDLLECSKDDHYGTSLDARQLERLKELGYN